MRQKEQPKGIASSLQADVSAIETLINAIAQMHHLSQSQIVRMLQKSQASEYIPSSIFKNNKLGFIEALIKFLKEGNQLTFHQIAVILKRDNRVVWTTYHNSQKKMKEKLSLTEPSLPLPISIFTKGQGPLQSIAKYLHDDLNMGFSEIAELISRESSSVWACYHKKNSESSEEKNPAQSKESNNTKQ